ncbi:hypothetical protein [Bradyrhizobium sp.]|uniref:hypothetical protein n=1 Tax=Bradyrhizobium sp. TaxID=376 RepID=UPI003C754AC3
MDLYALSAGTSTLARLRAQPKHRQVSACVGQESCGQQDGWLCGVATVGWLIGMGWAAVELIRWLAD